MTTDITIPPEARTAARKAFIDAALAEPQPDPIEAALRAALNAWPGMEIEHDTWREPRTLHLPLPQKETPMLKAEQVPKAVVDAYIDAAMSQGLSFREALAAIINAWPGVERAWWTDKALILPLPREARDE